MTQQMVFEAHLILPLPLSGGNLVTRIRGPYVWSPSLAPSFCITWTLLPLVPSEQETKATHLWEKQGQGLFQTFCVLMFQARLLWTGYRWILFLCPAYSYLFILYLLAGCLFLEQDHENVAQVILKLCSWGWPATSSPVAMTTRVLGYTRLLSLWFW